MFPTKHACTINRFAHVHVHDYIMQGTVSDSDELVQWNRVKMNGNVAMRIGSQKQVSGIEQRVATCVHNAM